MVVETPHCKGHGQNGMGEQDVSQQRYVRQNNAIVSDEEEHSQRPPNTANMSNSLPLHKPCPYLCIRTTSNPAVDIPPCTSPPHADILSVHIPGVHTQSTTPHAISLTSNLAPLPLSY